MMGHEYGEFIFKAVPLLILAGATIPLIIVYRYLKTKYEDGPDYHDS